MSEKIEHEIMSLHSELARSRDYADTSMYPTDHLTRTRDYWTAEKLSPERSERSMMEISILLARMAFELDQRTREAITLDKLYEESV